MKTNCEAHVLLSLQFTSMQDFMSEDQYGKRGTNPFVGKVRNCHKNKPEEKRKISRNVLKSHVLFLCSIITATTVLAAES